MPSQFEIVKTISRGRKQGHAQITVAFQGRSVTRHIINGIGRHPDDTIPGLHQRLHEAISENEGLTADKKMAMAVLAEKKPKGWVDLAAKMQREVRVLEEALPGLKASLAAVQKEDPLMVRYI